MVFLHSFSVGKFGVSEVGTWERSGREVNCPGSLTVGKTGSGNGSRTGCTVRAPKTGSNGCSIDVDVWPVMNASAGEANNDRIGAEFRLEDVAGDSGIRKPAEGFPRVAKELE